MTIPVHIHQLSLSEEQTATLKKKYGEVIFQLENSMSLYPRQLEQLRREMRLALESQSGITDLITDAQVNHHLLWLQHADNAILNLPWRLAVEDVPHLYLANGLVNGKSLPPFTPTNPLPLKILVMISSPEDSSDSSRLSFEQEEDQIIQAFQELYAIGKVQIDFTEDGSLEELERKLNANHYHILHFSGHSVYRDGKGYLLLEDAITMQSRLVTAEDFAKTLSSKPEHLPALVLLYSCQSAQGSASDEFKGITNRLLELGVPAVIAMGLSVRDAYATEFAGELYRILTLEQPLYEAFKSAVDYIRLLERELEQNKAAGQWMIPQLFFSRPLEQLVDWKASWSDLQQANLDFITGENRLLLDYQPGYQFIGRRRERRQALKPLLNKQTVLLQGQGGVGKTALAEHLVQRIMLQNPKIQPFVFNEHTTSFELIFQAFFRYLESTHKQFLIKKEVADHSEKAIEQFHFLLDRLSVFCEPLFVFDNLESFQQEPGGAFAEEFADVIEMLTYLCESGSYPVLLTSRYPLSALAGLTSIDLHQVRFADFWRKCQQLAISELQIMPAEAPGSKTVSFKQISLLLYHAIGGNYRALEFFDELYRKNHQKSFETLEKLDAFLKTQKQGLRIQMSENLIFQELLSLFSASARHLLLLLCYFRRPVLSLALEMQDDKMTTVEQANLLDQLVNYTLIERHHDEETNSSYYYITPLVKDLVFELPTVPFSHQLAGDYYYVERNHYLHMWSYLEECFYHYELANEMSKINEIGSVLSSYYYQSSFSKAYHYAAMTEKLLGPVTAPQINNRLGLILNLHGHYEQGLVQFEQAYRKFQEIGDSKAANTVLANIGQTYYAQNDYSRALDYLEKSLCICQKINDREGESNALNSISVVFIASGNYHLALDYLMRSLQIKQEIGNYEGQATTLNNISQAYHAFADYDRALDYLVESLSISESTGDRREEGTTLSTIGLIHLARGDYEHALSYLEQSLLIRQEIGDRAGEATALNNISQTYHALSNFERALDYLVQSLLIYQDLDNRAGEITTMNNIAAVAYTSGYNDRALKFLEHSLHLAHELDNREAEVSILNNISQIYKTRGAYEHALDYLSQSLHILKKMDNRGIESSILNNVGEIYCQLKNYDQALSFFEQNLPLQREIGDRAGVSLTLNNIGQVYQELGDYELALRHLEQSLRIQQDIGDQFIVGAVLNNIGLNYHKCGDNYQALKYLKQSLQISQKIGHSNIIAHASNNIGVIYFEQKKYDEAISVFMQAYGIFNELESPNAIISQYHLSAILEKVGEDRYNEILERF